MPKSKSRSVYEKLSPTDQRQVDFRTGRVAGIQFTEAYPTVSFDEAVKEVAGQPGAYTTKPGGTIGSARLGRKAKGRSF